jgi:pimeloyl-ACP methyl ester carboxylesterase
LLIDLVQTTTRDGVRLDGAFQAPATKDSSALGLDAVVLVHGTGSNFYGSTMFESIAARFLELGCGVLRINTRGHDGISTAATALGGKRLGAAYEIVDDCRHDLGAWVDWLKQRAGPRIGLIGHSLGAVKCLYAMAHDPALGAQCVVAISPPRLSYSWFCSGPEGPSFLETYARAERHVESREPAALIEVKLPLHMIIAAAGYVEKYGPDERYNYLRFVPSVACPTIVTLGSLEVANNMAFRGAPEALSEVRNRSGRLTSITIAGADHFYSRVRAELVARIEEWLREHVSPNK